MSPGTHVLELATVMDASGGRIESAKSAPLRVTVLGASGSVEGPSLLPGDRILTRDGVRLEAETISEDHTDITDMAVTRRGWLVIAERHGGIVFHTSEESFNTAVDPADGEVLAVAPHPDFEETRLLFVLQGASSVFRVARYRLAERQLVDRMLVLPDVAASADPAGTLKFGPDGKLHVAFDNAGSTDLAARLSAWSGKILRINIDGSTPDDQPAASPVMWANLGRPRGLAWSRDGQVMYVAERGADDVERLRAIVSTGRPRRASMRSSYVLPAPVGAASISMASGEGIPEFDGNLFIAAREGGYLLRVIFEEDATRAKTSETLLEGRIGDLRAVVSSADGLYVANRDAVWRLFPVRTP
jgi:glucose/arabinose dehydrogenase